MKSRIHACILNIFYGLTRVNQYSLRCKQAELTIGLVKEFYIVDENILGHDLNFKLFEYLERMENRRIKRDW